VLSQYFRPEHFRVNDLVDWLVARGHRVEVLTGQPNYPAGRFAEGYGWSGPWTEQQGAVRVMRVPLLPRGAGGGLRLALNYLSFALVASLVAPFRCRGRYDAIFVHEPSPMTVGIPAAMLRWTTGAPVLFWILDLWPESVTAAGGVRSRPVLAALHALVRWILARCDRVLVQSQGFVPLLRERGVAAERIRYLPNWAEPPGAPQGGADWPALAPGFQVVYAGNIGASQDFGTVLAAAERLRHDPRIRWTVVGDGREAAWLREEVTRRGLADRFAVLPARPASAMPALFAAADAMLVALRADPLFALTVPAKVQAYLAAGRPIVALLDGEGARIVREAGAGAVAACGDPAALARAVLELAALTPAQRAALGEAGARYSARWFDRETLLCELEGWMSEAAAARGGPTDI